MTIQNALVYNTFHVCVSKVWFVNDNAVRLFHPMINHIRESAFWIIGSKSFMLVPHSINIQVRAFTFKLSTNQIPIYTFIIKFWRTRHFRGQFYNAAFFCKMFCNLHQFRIIAIVWIDKTAYTYFTLAFFYDCLSVALTLLDKNTC